MLRNLNRICDDRKKRTAVRYIGFFPGRKRHAIRISLFLSETSRLCEYIADLFPRLNLPFNRYSSIKKPADCFVLNIDASETIRLPFSVEFRLDRNCPQSQLRWNRILDESAESPDCSSEKIPALREWCGSSWELFHPVLSGYHTHRLINHLKATFLEDGSSNWKAYFGFVNVPLQ
jgi:hypothetical protein